MPSAPARRRRLQAGGICATFGTHRFAQDRFLKVLSAAPLATPWPFLRAARFSKLPVSVLECFCLRMA